MRRSLATVLFIAIAAVDGAEGDNATAYADSSVTQSTAGYASRWAVQLDGHHVALNITIDGEAYSISPSFIGSYPQTFTVAGSKLRPLAAMTDLAHELATSLTPEQRTLAIVANRRGALRVGPGQDDVYPEPVGIPVGLLDDSQRRQLLGLASQWFDLMPPPRGQAQRNRLIETLGDTRFAWSGPVAAGSDVSWVIQAPWLVIEYANDARGDDAADPVQHVHTVYRDLDRDYGGPGDARGGRARSSQHTP